MKSVLLSAAVALCLVVPATAQTDTGTPALTPLAPLPDLPKPAPHAGRAAKLPVLGKPDSPPKPTKEELAEKRKLDHDMRICIGC